MSKFVLLKDVPVAVARLEDKIYAFTASGVYLIDRNKFVELGFDESITVSHKNWVATTPIGIIVINDRSIYLNSGDGFRDIGESIGRSTDIQIAWANKIALSGSNCATGYDSYYRCIVVSATYSGAIPNVCFMITRDGSIFPFATSYLPRCFSYNGKHKRTMYGNTRGLSTLMDSSANRDWTITTQCLRLGRDLMYKKFYKAYVIAESSPTRIAVSNEMGTDLVGDVTHDANTKLYEYKIRSSDDWKQRGIYIYISGTAIVDTIGVVHRQYRSPR